MDTVYSRPAGMNETNDLRIHRKPYCAYKCAVRLFVFIIVHSNKPVRACSLYEGQLCCPGACYNVLSGAGSFASACAVRLL